MLENLEEAEVDGSVLAAAQALLVGRLVKYDDGCRTISRNTETGCPQGSCASPDLWKIGANGLLNRLRDEAIQAYTFAEDVGIVLIEKD